MPRAIPFMQYRGGSSKSICFSAADLPADIEARDALLLDAMGRDARQVDGMGGGHPLTSKVAVIGPSGRTDCDVDYLFAQVVVGENRVDTTPNCGNILAAVGPFAIENGLVTAQDGETVVHVNMLNTGSRCALKVRTPGGHVQYDGEARIDGVSGTAAPVICQYSDIAGAVCGALLPTGNRQDTINGMAVTCIDNGMPVVIVAAESLGKTGRESPDELMADSGFRQQLEQLRLAAGPLMHLGEVGDKVVPKMTLVSRPINNGTVHTRTFIPHTCHAAIGVLGAVSVATACLLDGTVTRSIANLPAGNPRTLSIEHPAGEFSIEVMQNPDQSVQSVGLLRTVRLISRGELYI